MAKKHKCPDFENHERWLVSYADMMTLLFALFVVLYALKNADPSDNIAGQVAAASAEVFSQSLEEIPLDKRKAPEKSGFGVFEHLKGVDQKTPLMRKFPNSKDRNMIINEEINKLKLRLEDPNPGERRSTKTATKGSSRIVSVVKSNEGIVIRLLASAFYKPSQYSLGPAAKRQIDKIIKELIEIGRPITIEGHTDNVEPTGVLGNYELSALRASHVVKYIIKKHNFPLSQISAAGWGDAKPIAHNGSTSGRRLNRRIEIKVRYE
jgi:chemotaxis protein MotB